MGDRERLISHVQRFLVGRRCFSRPLLHSFSVFVLFFANRHMKSAFMTVTCSIGYNKSKTMEGERGIEMYYAIPTVVVSECLGFSACRYNGDIIHNSFVSRLGEFARLVPVCPEVAIGLGVPRETVRLVKRGEERRLVQSSTNRDWTREMNEFAASFFGQVGEVDGFILKGRSPTCGIKDVRVYDDEESGMVVEKGVGLFAEHVFRRFPNAAIEEEGRLTNAAIREHFLDEGVCVGFISRSEGKTVNEGARAISF